MRYLEFVCETCGKSFVTPQGGETVRHEYAYCPICGGDVRLMKERGAKEVVPGMMAWFECGMHWDLVIGVRPEQAGEVWMCPVCGDHDGIERLDEDGDLAYVRTLAGGREEEEAEYAEA